MIYSKLYLRQNIEIPTIAVFLFIIFIILIFWWIFSKSSKPSSAFKNNIQRLEITNISSSSVTIFWQTDKKEVGWVSYGVSPKNLNNIAIDERDITSQKKPYFNHYVILRGLEENKQYFFAIFSGNRLVTGAKNNSFRFTTFLGNQMEKNINLAYGRVIQVNNLPLEGAIVLLSLDGKVFASTLTKSTGEWLIPLNYKKLTPSSKIKIEILSEDNQNSTIVTTVNKISPLPATVVIGKHYDFTQEDNILSATSEKLSANDEKKDIEILYPKEGAIIPGRLPLIKGIAPSNTMVYISIKSNKTYSTKVRADDKGFWSFLPPEVLSLGEYIISITAKNKEGRDVSVERKFFIIGNEGANVSVLGEATPSATKTFTQPSLTLTPIPTLTKPVVITTVPSPPTSGINFFLLSGVGLSLFILGLGIILAF